MDRYTPWYSSSRNLSHRERNTLENLRIRRKQFMRAARDNYFEAANAVDGRTHEWFMQCTYLNINMARDISRRIRDWSL